MMLPLLSAAIGISLLAFIGIAAATGPRRRITKDGIARGITVVSIEIDGRYGVGTYLVKGRENGSEVLYNVSIIPFRPLQWIRL